LVEDIGVEPMTLPTKVGMQQPLFLTNSILLH
jgi:hypothetical protein